MKSSFLALASLLTLAIASPVTQLSDAQVPLGGDLPTSYPGYSLDLAEQRLVELEGQAPVWMSELEKVSYRYPSLV